MTMRRIIDVDFETRCKKPETALNRFFKKYPELEDEWRETLEYMVSEGVENFTDDRMADGSYNNEWNYSLWFEDHDGSYYIAVVIRDEEPEATEETAQETAPKREAFVSYGNTKTGIPSFNLLAGNQSHPYDGTAPRKFDGSELRQICGTCNTDCPGCYAKAMTRYDGTFTHYAENTYMAYSDPVALVQSLEAQLYASPVTAPRVFRLHDSGDFATWEYFCEIMAMIRRHPETQYGAYTKRADLVNRYGLENLPDNLSLQCSPWEGHCEPIGDLPQFIYDDGTRPELAELPHCPAVDKNGKRTGVQCKDCLHCYFSKRGQRWAVYAH